jgi:hypothetical protein
LKLGENMYLEGSPKRRYICVPLTCYGPLARLPRQ